MERDPLTALAGLLMVIVLIAGMMLMGLRSGAGRGRRQEIALGYPPDRFPEQELVHSGSLKALAAAQARLLSVHAQLPQQSELALWLWAFLHELRPIMDAAYQAAVVARLYNQPAPLERLVHEVEAIERGIAQRVVKRLLNKEACEAAMDHEDLALHLAVLRHYARELAARAAEHTVTA